MVQAKIYAWAGLSLESPIELPELSQIRPSTSQSDIVLRLHRWSDYTPSLRGQANQSYLQAVEGGGLLLRAPGYAQFVIHPSGVVDIRIEEGAEDVALRAFVLGPVLAAVTYLRGWIPLHAGAVAVGGRAMLFCGDSGAGKSTFVAHLAARGHRVLCDDVCVVDNSIQGPAVLATDRSVKLWPDTLRRVTTQLSCLQAVDLAPHAAAKSKLQFSASLAPQATKIHSIYELVRVKALRTVRITPLSGARALQLAIEHSLRKRMIGVLEIQVEHLRRSAALMHQTQAFRLEIPDDFARLSKTLTALEASWGHTRHVEVACNENVQINPTRT